jgi:protein-disulfide isomerase
MESQTRTRVLRRCGLTALVLVLTASAPAQEPLSIQAPLSEASRQAFEQIIHQYILQHPEVLRESARLGEERERAAQQERTKAAVLARLKDIQQDPSSPVVGKDGGVTVVEFFDYHCGYCKRTESAVRKVLADHPEVHFVFKEFPILGAESSLAAKAGLAAAKQGGYLKFHQALMDFSGPITMAALEELAGKQGLDANQLKTDIESAEVQSILKRNQDLARDLGVRSTPTFVIGSELVLGTIDDAEFEKFIAQAQSRANPQAALKIPKQ